jgi:ATP-binding cassette subfamily B protein/subfamily B ATP-binding cassette protein MsbA
VKPAAWWRRLLPFGRPYRTRLLAIGALIFVAAFLLAATPLPIKVAVDDVLAGEGLPAALSWVERIPLFDDATGQLVFLGLLMIALLLATAVVTALAQVERETLGQRMSFDLAAVVLETLQRRSYVHLGATPTGDTVQRVIADSRCVDLLITFGILGVASAAANFFVMVAIAAQLDLGLTVVVFLAAVPMFLIIRRFMRPMAMASIDQANADGAVMSTAEFGLAAVEEVQSFTAEEIEEERLDAAVDRRVHETMRVQRLNLAYEICIGLFTACATAYVLAAGGIKAINGSTTIGDLLVLSTYIGLMFAPIVTVASLTKGVVFAQAMATRVLEVLDSGQEVPEPARPVHFPPAKAGSRVLFDDVTFGYGERAVLSNVTLEVEPGERVAVVGRTGAGKTTLLSMIPRFFDPWTGRVVVDGVDVRDVRVHDARERVSIVHQNPVLLPLSVAENISYGRPSASRHEIEDAARAALASEFIDNLPDGYDTVLGEWGTTLSGGQRQRLAIARAFLKDAPILILDEPTSALDPRSEALLVEAIERLSQHRTVLVIAHRLSTVRRADRIVVLEQGRVVEQGTHDELLSCGGHYANFHFLQARDTAGVRAGQTSGSPR